MFSLSNPFINSSGCAIFTLFQEYIINTKFKQLKATNNVASVLVLPIASLKWCRFPKFSKTVSFFLMLQIYFLFFSYIYPFGAESFHEK